MTSIKLLSADPTIAKALAFATKAHGDINQLRKYTAAPYIVHPVAVAEMVAEVGGDVNMIAAALLHDVVEDTPVSIEEIRELFGDDITSLVEDLTDVSTVDDGNRDARKAIDRAHSATAKPRAMTIKLADLISNSISIIEYDPAFAITYLNEKALMLPLLVNGNPVLHAKASAILANGLLELGLSLD